MTWTSSSKEILLDDGFRAMLGGKGGGGFFSDEIGA